MSARPRIAIIGDGNVGSALLEGWRRTGHDVEAVGNEPERVRQLAHEADLIVLAVPFGQRFNAVDEMGEDIDGKVLVDVTNALDDSYGFAATFDRSGAEDLQERAPGARVVKAFNTVFAQNMSRGTVLGEPLTVLVAGDDEAAKETVMGLARAIGFDGLDAGPIANARWLEALGFLNIQLGFGQKLGSDIGFRVVRKETARMRSARREMRGRADKSTRARSRAKVEAPARRSQRSNTRAGSRARSAKASTRKT